MIIQTLGNAYSFEFQAAKWNNIDGVKLWDIFQQIELDRNTSEYLEIVEKINHSIPLNIVRIERVRFRSLECS